MRGYRLEVIETITMTNVKVIGYRNDNNMTQDERWMAKWNIAKGFIETNRRNPSKFDGAEREIRNWIKHNRKLYTAGLLKEDRVERFEELLNLSEQYRRKNQYE